MASLEESLIASAIEALDIEDYWPTFDSNKDIDDDDDSEYSIILYFYENLVDHLRQRHSVRNNDIKEAIQHLVYNYSHVSNGRTPQDLDYNHLSNCLGYLHRYAACHTALVLSVMIRIFHKSPPSAVRRILALRTSLNVLCLGSGPGNDLVGFLSALYGKHFGLLELNVAVSDKMSGWEVIFQETLRRLRLGECGNVSRIFRESNVMTAFLLNDLINLSEWSIDFKERLMTADMVLLSKVLSVVPNSEKLPILKNVVMSMKPGALLIFIDCPYPSAEFTEMQKYLDIVYEASKERFHFNFEVERFGYKNIIASRAHVRVCVRKFMSLSPN